MARLMAAVLVLSLLLSGCGQTSLEQETQPTEATADSAVASAEESLPGLYLPDSAIETATDGAVRIYTLPDGTCAGLAVMGQSLLILTENQEFTLTRTEGGDLIPAAQRTLDVQSLPVLAARADSVGYYDPVRRSVVFLNELLEESSCFSMPEDMEGTPVIGPDGESVYYIAGSDLRVLTLNTGISRLLKQTRYTELTLLGTFLDGEALLMTAQDADQQICAVLSANTGETLYTTEELPAFSTYEDRFLYESSQGTVYQLVYGSTDGTLRCLTPTEGDTATPVLTQDGCILVADNGVDTVLSFYDLETGCRSAEVTLAGVLEVTNFAVYGQRIYFTGTSDGVEALYSWDVRLSPTGEQTDYTQVYYTRDNVDETGLEDCATEAAEIGEKYGVDLRIWEDALADLDGVTLESEYQVAAYQRDLAALETALAQFPEGFFETAAGTGGTLHICLVRSIDGAGWEQIGEGACLLLQQDGESFLWLTMGEDLTAEFYHGLGHVIDSRVLGNSTLFDSWEELNPSGFTYDYDYEVNQQRDGDAYLEGETRAFTDVYAMSYPKEDRASIFAYAMLQGNEDYFASEIMQNKLERLCKGIRDAFGYEDLEQTLPWEKYLG